MAYKRNRSRRQFLNDNKLYEEFFDKKNKTGFVQYTSPQYNEISEADRRSIQSKLYIWKTGDRFYKLAYEMYGRVDYWWIIALFNKKPTESHVKPGDEILIPIDYEAVIQLYGV